MWTRWKALASHGVLLISSLAGWRSGVVWQSWNMYHSKQEPLKKTCTQAVVCAYVSVIHILLKNVKNRNLRFQFVWGSSGLSLGVGSVAFFRFCWLCCLECPGRVRGVLCTLCLTSPADPFQKRPRCHSFQHTRSRGPQGGPRAGGGGSVTRGSGVSSPLMDGCPFLDGPPACLAPVYMSLAPQREVAACVVMALKAVRVYVVCSPFPIVHMLMLTHGIGLQLGFPFLNLQTYGVMLESHSLSPSTENTKKP